MTLSDLKALALKATPGPWRYRPSKYDDWGWVRAPNDATVAIASRGDWDYDAVASGCRENGTDPFEHNAAYIAAVSPEIVLALVEVALAITPSVGTTTRLDAALAKLDALTSKEP